MKMAAIAAVLGASIHTAAALASARPVTDAHREALAAEHVAHHRVHLEEGTVTYLIYGGIAIAAVVGIGAAAYWLTARQVATEEKENAETANEPEPELNVEKLLKLVVKRTAQSVGPKITKANNVKSVLEKRVYGFKNRAANFIMGELYCTVAGVLKEVEAEEAMLLFDPSAAASSNMPPVSILIAGALSQTVLSISMVIHLSQIFLVLLPVMAMCAVSLYLDWDTLDACAVPTIWFWLYFQGGLALILLVGHLVTTMRVSAGKASIRAKSQSLEGRLRDALADGELSIHEIRELFLVCSILLEHSLVVEDGLRRSVWRSVIGVGTVAWMLMTLWTFIIVLGWTFIPGMVAFHPTAAKVAGKDYCGAWATVFSARLSCVLSLLFLMFNAISVLQWLSDRLVTSEAYSAGMIAWAKSFDEQSGGFPVMQTLVKAFLLRGNGDSLKDQIAQSYNTKYILQQQEKELVARIDALDSRISTHKDEAAALKKLQGIPVEDDLDRLEKKVQAKTEAELAKAVAEAKALEESTRMELEALYNKFLDAAKQVRESDAVKGALAQAQELQEGGLEGFQDAATSSYASAQEAALEGLATAQQTAQGGLAAAQEAAQDAAGRAQDAAGRAVEQGRALTGK